MVYRFIKNQQRASQAGETTNLGAGLLPLLAYLIKGVFFH